MTFDNVVTKFDNAVVTKVNRYDECITDHRSHITQHISSMHSMYQLPTKLNKPGVQQQLHHNMATFTADEEALETFSDDIGSLWCRPVAVLEQPPDAFTFLRDFVHPNVPCIIRNAIKSGDDALRLSLDDIIDRVGEDVILTCDVTPDGHGDCVRNVLDCSRVRQAFVKPHEQQMSIAEFRRLLRKDYDADKCNRIEEELEAFPLCNNFDERETTNPSKRRSSPVVYYSKQSDCLRTEMKELFSRNIFPESFHFAEEAFGTGPPDAINLWIGNERSVSSMHKDFYHNLFYVSSGQKEFLLNPPADHLFLHEGEFPCATFTPVEAETSNDIEWAVTLDKDDSESGSPKERRTKWIEPDVTKDNIDKFPLLAKSHTIKVLVSEGEMLYIPPLWYHRVTQTCETVGVNYWFDMKFDAPIWCYFNFLQHLSPSHCNTSKV